MQITTATARPPRSTNAWIKGRTKTIPTGLDPRLKAIINDTPLLGRDAERVLTQAIADGVRACWDACLGAGPSAAQRHAIHAAAVAALPTHEEASEDDAAPLTLTPPPVDGVLRRRTSGPSGPTMTTAEATADIATIIPRDLNWAALRAAQASAKMFAVATQAAAEWRRTLTTTAAHLDRLVSRMTAANMRLVMLIASKERIGLPFADLVQEGCTGLLKAIRRFDPSRGLAFCTFAVHWIRADIGRANDDKGELIRRPVGVIDYAPKAMAARAAYAKEHGKPPTVAELAVILNRSVDVVAAALGPVGVKSIDAPVLRSGSSGARFERNLSDYIHDIDAPSPIDLLDRGVAEAKVLNAITMLKPIEQDIIRRHFGVGAADENTETLADIGKSMSISRERVRQIQKQACDRIHRICTRRTYPTLNAMQVAP